MNFIKRPWFVLALLSGPTFLALTGCEIWDQDYREYRQNIAKTSSAPSESRRPAPPATLAIKVENKAEDPLKDLPSYRPQTVLEGRLRSAGSDTMDRLFEAWEVGFKVHHPNLQFLHEGKGSGTAIPNLLKELSDVGPMSRQINDKERDQFLARQGYPPVQLRVAIDALAIYVHPTNPITRQGLTLKQLDAIFSSTRKQGQSNEFFRWGDLELQGSWAEAPLHIFSRNKASGTYAFFREHVLKGGDFKLSNQEVSGSGALVEAVGQDPMAIGYSGVGYKTDSVAFVPLMGSAGTLCEPKEAKAVSGEYPLSRFLYLTFDYKPGSKLKAQQEELIRFVLSQEGQKIVRQEGYFTLTPAMIREELARVGL